MRKQNDLSGGFLLKSMRYGRCGKAMRGWAKVFNINGLRVVLTSFAKSVGAGTIGKVCCFSDL